MRVVDIMRKSVVTIGADSTFSEAARLLQEHGISAVVVLAENAPKGIVTERDFVTLVANGGNPAAVTVGDRMTTELITVQPKTDLAEAAQLMSDHHVRHLPVLERGRLVGILSIRDPVLRHPALRRVDQERRQSVQARLADAITAFAGSMPFVYLHLVWFALWIGLRLEKYPFGLLTMIVSLEAIFLATFVMISQNRADAKRQALADHQWEMVQYEEKQNEELLALSTQILDLTGAIHALTVATEGRNDGTVSAGERS